MSAGQVVGAPEPLGSSGLSDVGGGVVWSVAVSVGDVAPETADDVPDLLVRDVVGAGAVVERRGVVVAGALDAGTGCCTDPPVEPVFATPVAAGSGRT
jgi:hypothetical protein